MTPIEIEFIRRSLLSVVIVSFSLWGGQNMYSGSIMIWLSTSAKLLVAETKQVMRHMGIEKIMNFAASFFLITGFISRFTVTNNYPYLVSMGLVSVCLLISFLLGGAKANAGLIGPFRDKVKNLFKRNTQINSFIIISLLYPTWYWTVQASSFLKWFIPIFLSIFLLSFLIYKQISKWLKSFDDDEEEHGEVGS